MWLWFSESLKLRQRKQSPLYQIELYDHDKSTPFRAKLWVRQRSRSCGLEDRRTQISVCSRVLHHYSINMIQFELIGKARFQFGWWLCAYFVGGSSSRRVKVGVGQNFCQHPSRKLLLMLLWKSPRIQERAGSLALHLYSNIFGNELRRCNALHVFFRDLMSSQYPSDSTLRSPAAHQLLCPLDGWGQRITTSRNRVRKTQIRDSCPSNYQFSAILTNVI